MNDDPAFWLMRVDINLQVLDLLALHGAGCMMLNMAPERISPQLRERYAGLVNKLGLMLVDIGAMTALERDIAHAVDEVPTMPVIVGKLPKEPDDPPG